MNFNIEKILMVIVSFVIGYVLNVVLKPKHKVKIDKISHDKHVQNNSPHLRFLLYGCYGNTENEDYIKMNDQFRKKSDDYCRFIEPYSDNTRNKKQCDKLNKDCEWRRRGADCEEDRDGNWQRCMVYINGAKPHPSSEHRLLLNGTEENECNNKDWLFERIKSHLFNMIIPSAYDEIEDFKKENIIVNKWCPPINKKK